VYIQIGGGGIRSRRNSVAKAKAKGFLRLDIAHSHRENSQYSQKGVNSMNQFLISFWILPSRSYTGELSRRKRARPFQLNARQGEDGSDESDAEETGSKNKDRKRPFDNPSCTSFNKNRKRER